MAMSAWQPRIALCEGGIQEALSPTLLRRFIPCPALHQLLTLRALFFDIPCLDAPFCGPLIRTNILIPRRVLVPVGRVKMLRAYGRPNCAYDSLEHDGVAVPAEGRADGRSARCLKAEEKSRDEN